MVAIGFSSSIQTANQLHDVPPTQSIEDRLSDMYSQAGAIVGRLMAIAGIPLPPLPQGTPVQVATPGVITLMHELQELLNRIGEHTDQLQRTIGRL